MAMLASFFIPDSFFITCEKLLKVHTEEMSGLDKAYDPILNINNPWNHAELDIIIDFVRRWNNRVPIGRHKQKIKNKLISLKTKFKMFDGIVLEKIKFDNENVEAIKKIFKVLSEVSLNTEKKKFTLGSTGPSKLMHGINPKLFVMWDDGICAHYGCAPTADGYIHFMQFMQHIAQALLKNPSNRKKLEATGRTLPKLIDEYNWINFRSSKSR